MVICLERSAELHIAQLMPLCHCHLPSLCFSKIQIGFASLVPAHPGSPRQRAIKWVWVYVCVCVCVRACVRACVVTDCCYSCQLLCCSYVSWKLSLKTNVVSARRPSVRARRWKVTLSHWSLRSTRPTS